jgi:hypothetical protein
MNGNAGEVTVDPLRTEGLEGQRWFGLVQRGGCWNINEDESYSNVRDNASADFDLGGFVGLRPVRNVKANG